MRLFERTLVVFVLGLWSIVAGAQEPEEALTDSLECDTVAAVADTLAVSVPDTVQLPDIEVCLLTCSPGKLVYELYGHTAIRCIDHTQGLDIVFNYGVFDFNAPHFLWRFVLGQCDYMVQPLPWEIFYNEYRERGSSITSQTLNLTPQEAVTLMAALLDNCQPEKRNYRYNFLFNNCTTMVRDRIEANVAGEVIYKPMAQKQTFRQILRHYTRVSEWAREGNDLLLGAAVDTVLSDRAQMFAPEYLMQYADSALIRTPEGNTRPLVAKKEILLEARTLPVAQEDEFPLGPSACAMALLVACVCIVCAEQLSNRMFWGWDILLMTLQGVAGCLLAFMFLFSEHPAVDSNWQIWVLNPLALLLMPWVVRCAYKKQWTWLHYVNFAILALFLAFAAWIPQSFCQMTFPVALSLLTRPISYYIYYRRNNL